MCAGYTFGFDFTSVSLQYFNFQWFSWFRAIDVHFDTKQLHLEMKQFALIGSRGFA